MSLPEETLSELTEYALGLCEPEVAQAIEARLRRDPALAAELDLLRENLFGEPGLALETPIVEPSASARERLMAAVQGADRFAPFAQRMAQLFGLSVEAVAELLRGLDTCVWTPTAAPGVSFVHFQAGPALTEADTGFVRFEAGAEFPHHRHEGPELTFILEGVLYFSTGETLRPGDEIVLGLEHRHSVRAGDVPVVYATYHHGFQVEAEGPTE